MRSPKCKGEEKIKDIDFERRKTEKVDVPELGLFINVLEFNCRLF